MLRELVTRLGVAGPANAIWQEIYPYTLARMRRDATLRRLIGYMVPSGSTVFDIGANRGIYSELFKSMGARVVSVEPNNRLASRLRRRGMEVVEAAVSDKNGYTDFYPGEIEGLSTVSPGYTQLRRYRQFKWKSPVTVPTITLDSLSLRYGIPSFIKIDVEGNEPAVLRGMGFAPNALTFEFIPEDMQSLSECVSVLESLAAYEYTYTIGLTPGMTFNIPWNTQQYLLQHIECCAIPGSFGDVWARRIR